MSYTRTHVKSASMKAGGYQPIPSNMNEFSFANHYHGLKQVIVNHGKKGDVQGAARAEAQLAKLREAYPVFTAEFEGN